MQMLKHLLHRVVRHTRPFFNNRLPERIQNYYCLLTQTPGLLQKIELLLVTLSTVAIALANQSILTGPNL